MTPIKKNRFGAGVWRISCSFIFIYYAEIYYTFKRNRNLRMNPNILIVDDEEVIQAGLQRYLGKAGFRTTRAYSLREAREKIDTTAFNAILLDVRLPDGMSLELIQEIGAKYEDVPVIVMSGVADIPSAVKAIQSGAVNFITKPLEIEGLGLSVCKCLEHEELKKQEIRSKRLKKVAPKPFFGVSAQSKRLNYFADVAAKNESVVLLLGETGTGKGVLAKWIHENSSRASGSFVELNCSALRGELLKSELYGHCRGSFTSALKDREGLIEIADGGTLFLDEIGDMDLGVQAELLKTIEEKKFRRIGENKIRTSDFRLICATNKSLRQESDAGKFRSDLYYRICVFPIEMPSLRERRDDIPGLLKYFLQGFGYTRLPLNSNLLNSLVAYPWPGNIREMKNVLERALLLSQGKSLDSEHFPGLETGAKLLHEFDQCTLKEMVQMHIERTMERFNNDVAAASRCLGISVKALKDRLKAQDFIVAA